MTVIMMMEESFMNNIINKLNPLNNMTEQNIKSLMKKTKAQLIDVISRKDATELSLNEKINNLQEKITELESDINDLNCTIIDKNKCISELERESVESSIQIENLSTKNEDYKKDYEYIKSYNKELITKVNHRENYICVMAFIFIVVEILTLLVLE